MTAMAGGAADKAGNRYEHLWTANRLADLLEGRASRIRLEPPGPAGQGIEFEIDEGDETWAEQVKGSLSGGSWTIRRLESEGVLASALHQVRNGRRFRLIAALQARALDTLSSRSRQTVSLDEFKAELTDDLRTDFGVLVDAWAVQELEAWTHLKSVYVENLPLHALERVVSTQFKLLVAGDATEAIDDLRGFCEANIHVNVSGPLVWAHLEDRGFQRRHLAGDAGAAANLHQTVVRQSRRVGSVAPEIGLVASRNAARVLDALKDPDGAQVLFIDGRAGLGKSTVTAEVAEAIEREGWHVAVVRMDTLDNSTLTSARVGEQVGLGTNSPAVILAGVAAGQRALLVVDQLDAVSLYSGRIPAVFDAVEEIVDELTTSENVKVALIARTVDLEADRRLRRLSRQKRASRLTIEPLSEQDVRAKLDEAGIAVPDSAATLALLRTPLHLSLFLRLSEEARRDEYPSLQDLYGRYTEEIRTKVSRDVGHLNWAGITEALIDHMNTHELLVAPLSALDGEAPDEWRALESEAVLVRDGDNIAFFHESYFDYLFARAFVGSGRNLHEFLVVSGQHLFRRAQTRQVLEHLLATDRGQFRHTVTELASSDEIRPHITAIVAEVYGRIEPVAEDWLAIEEVAWANLPTSWRWLNYLGKPEWFDIVDKLGRWEEWLTDSEKVDRAFNQLVSAARTRPQRVAGLVRPFIGTSEDWRLRLKVLVEWSLRPESVDLAVELLEGGYLDDARGPIATNSDFWSIVYALADDDKAAAARLIGAYLDRGLSVAQAAGSDDPFETGQLPDHSQSDGIIDDIAEAAPTAYLDAVLHFVKTVAIANQHVVPDRLPVGRRWYLRHVDTAYSVDYKIFDGVDRALRALAASEPARCAGYIAELLHAESDELRFLACRALTVAGTADEAMRWLAADLRNLLLGWADSPRWATIELIRKWSSQCSDEVFADLEATVLSYEPSWEVEPRGRGRYQLLASLDEARLSLEARRMRDELASDHDLAEAPPPQAVMAHFVGSPIDSDAAAKMTDTEWIGALHEYDNDDTSWDGNRPVGGASQLAQMLGSRAAGEPERFARLALTFDAAIPSHAIDNVIRAVAKKIDPELLADLCEKSATMWPGEVGRTVCSAAADMDQVTDRMVALIASFADDPDPDREWARTESTSGLYYGGDIDSAGLNCTRGQAAGAAAVALFQSEGHMERLGGVVEDLATDPILGVRAQAAEAVLAVMNHDSERAYRIAEALFDTSDDIFASRHTERLLIYLVLREPERFGGLLGRALDAGDVTAKRAGQAWAVAAVRHALPSVVPTEVRGLSAAARCGAAEAFADDPGPSVTFLADLFNDDDVEVRKTASTAMRQLGETTDVEAQVLIESFLASESGAESYEGLIRKLPDCPQVDPELALRVCEQIVTLAGHQLGDIRTALSTLGQPIMRVVLAVYRQGDASERERCLDVIDRLSERDAYGWRDLLEDER